MRSIPRICLAGRAEKRQHSLQFGTGAHGEWEMSMRRTSKTRRPRVSFLLLAAAVSLFSVSPVRADIISYAANLSPEVLGATGTGFAQVVIDTTAHSLLVDATWSGLSGTTTVAHIHCCTTTAFTGTVGVAVTPDTLPDFPMGLTSGSYTPRSSI